MNQQNEKKEDKIYRIKDYKAGYIGFFTLAILMFFSAVFIGLTDFPKEVYELTILGGVILSLIIYLCICIWKDAYNPEKKPSSSILWVYTIWTIIFIGNGILKFRPDENNNVNVTLASIYLMFGIMFLVVLINFAAKKIVDKRKAKSEGSK